MKKLITVMAVVMLSALFAVCASAKTVKKGDVNMDNKVNAIDARIVLRAGAQLDVLEADQYLIGDMDKNQKITAMDARAILRIASQLDKNEETVEIGVETEVTRTELSDGFGISTDDFIKKYGGMRKLDTTDGTIAYTNDNVTVVHNPKMIYTGCINSITIVGGDYTLCGVYVGMSSSQAIKDLQDNDWRISSQTDTQVILERNAMRMKVFVGGGKITYAEYYIGFSLVGGSDDDTTTLPPETTTQPPETTTQPPETTTQPPETTTKPPETTTQPPETTTTPPETTTTPPETTTNPTKYPSGSDDFNSLPDQIKSYIIGEFAFDGFRYEKGEKTPVSMIFSNGNVKATMTDTSSSGTSLDLEMIVDNSGKSTKIYLVNTKNKMYCDMSTLIAVFPQFGSINTSDLSYSSVDVNQVVVNVREEVLSGRTYDVYNVKTSTADSCDFYLVDGVIKKMINYDSVGNIKSQIDIAKFRTNVDSSETSVKGYKKASIFEVGKVLGLS